MRLGAILFVAGVKQTAGGGAAPVEMSAQAFDNLAAEVSFRHVASAQRCNLLGDDYVQRGFGRSARRARQIMSVQCGHGLTL